MTALALPYPISTNRYWRTFRGRQVVSAEAREYKRATALAASLARVQPAHGPIALTVVYHPRRPKKWKGGPVRRHDADNVVKVACDALNGVAFHDDSQVVELHVIVAQPIEGGGLRVFIERKEAA